MQFASAFQYKKWANDELLELGEKQFSQLPENDATFFVRILNHTTVVDSLFISRILQKSTVVTIQSRPPHCLSYDEQ